MFCDVDAFSSGFDVFGGLGGLEGSKMVRGTRTIHLPVPIPHIDHSRTISLTQVKLLGTFGAWGETFPKNRSWELGHGLEL
mgnify:CR=1 FL=1